jgi:peptidyl-prolyl cis-trans isomerase SurA
MAQAAQGEPPFKTREDDTDCMPRLGQSAFVAGLGGAAIGVLSLIFAGAALGQITAPKAAPVKPLVSSVETAPPPPSPGQPPATPVLGAPLGSPVAEGVAVTVNDEIITSYDVVQRMRLLVVTAGIQPTEENLPEIQREAARSLVDERLEMQELRRQEKAQKFNLIASDAEVNEELAEIARSNNTSADQLLAQLAAQGVGAETFREQLRAEISWRGWIRGRYGSRVAVGEDQIKAYQKRLEAEAGKTQYLISEVVIDPVRAGGEAAAMQGANQLIQQIQKGAPIAAVARQFSNSPTAAAGGDAGWVSPGELPPEVERVVATLRPSQLSPPISTKDGVYIIYLRDRRAGSTANVVNMRQVAVAAPKSAPQAEIEAARTKLEQLRPSLAGGCDSLEQKAQNVKGVVVGDLGEAETKDLAPAFRGAAESLAVGQVSEPIRTDAGWHLLVMCSRGAAGGQQMTREQIENRLFGQELAMISKRQLRDLRNAATIDAR